MTETIDEIHMRQALMEAQKAFDAGEIPIGAVIFDGDNRLIAAEHNLRETTNDATAHAEILAIRRASERLCRWRLDDCTLYVTVEPCPMCAGAIVMARMGRFVYGATDVKGGGCESIFNITDNPALNHRVKATAGVLEDECAALMKRFLIERRKLLTQKR